MKREIKLRVWDGQRMRFPNLIDIYSGTCWTLDRIDPETIDTNHLMQFTGLKDKNGAEIYEGDLIRLTDNYNGSVAKGVAEVVFSHGYVGGWVITVDNYTFLTIGNRTNYVEVVGNIYANPELLKAEPQTATI